MAENTSNHKNVQLGECTFSLRSSPSTATISHAAIAASSLQAFSSPPPTYPRMGIADPDPRHARRSGNQDLGQ